MAQPKYAAQQNRNKTMSNTPVEYSIDDIRLIEDKARQMRGEALRYGITWIAARLRNATQTPKTLGALATQ